MKILIIEDEARIARRIERMIRSILKEDVSCMSVASTLKEGKAYIKMHTIDLLFLDLNLNGEDGFEVLKSVVSEAFHTIIISAYKDKAITAFEYGVLDFVAKPFTEDRLIKACQRLSLPNEQVHDIKYLSIHKKDRKVLIKVEEVAYIQGASVYTEIVQNNGEKDLHNKSLESLSALLPEHFERIHKSYIANMKMVSDVYSEPGSKYSLRLENGNILPIGRTKYKALKEKWFGL